jgi:hypothetical protein
MDKHEPSSAGDGWMVAARHGSAHVLKFDFFRNIILQFSKTRLNFLTIRIGIGTPSKEIFIGTGMQTLTAEMTTWLTQFCILASKLPGRSKPLPLRCDRCGNFLGGLVANDAAIVHGHFEPDIDFDEGTIGTKLAGYTLIVGKPEFKCANCGFVKRWHR